MEEATEVMEGAMEVMEVLVTEDLEGNMEAGREVNIVAENMDLFMVNQVLGFKLFKFKRKNTFLKHKNPFHI